MIQGVIGKFSRFDTMHTTAARKIMESLEQNLQKHEEDADKEGLIEPRPSFSKGP